MAIAAGMILDLQHFIVRQEIGSNIIIMAFRTTFGIGCAGYFSLMTTAAAFWIIIRQPVMTSRAAVILNFQQFVMFKVSRIDIISVTFDTTGTIIGRQKIMMAIGTLQITLMILMLEYHITAGICQEQIIRFDFRFLLEIARSRDDKHHCRKQQNY
jgi:hypothetical protein